MRRKLPLGIEALIFLLKVNSAQVERGNPRRLLHRKLSSNPHERARSREPCLDLFRGDAEHTGEQPRRHFWVGDLCGHRKAGLHLNAHGELPHVAVVNRAALGADFDDALLLALSAGQIVAVADKLEVAEAGQRCPHPQHR